MALVNRTASAAAVGLAILIGSGLSGTSAQAAYVVTMTQEGNNVVATGSGTIDLTDLSFLSSNSNPSLIIPIDNELILGPTTLTPYDYFGFFGDAPSLLPPGITPPSAAPA